MQIYFSLSGPSWHFWLFYWLETLLKNFINVCRWVITIATTHRFWYPDYFKLPSSRIIQHKINGPFCISTKITTCFCKIIHCNISGLLCILNRLNTCTLVWTVPWSSTITSFGLKNICFRWTCSLCFPYHLHDTPKLASPYSRAWNICSGFDIWLLYSWRPKQSNLQNEDL